MENEKKLTVQLAFTEAGALVDIFLNVDSDQQEKVITDALVTLFDSIILERVCPLYDR